MSGSSQRPNRTDAQFFRNPPHLRHAHPPRDTSKLTRQQSARAPKLPDRNTERNDDASKLARTQTFHLKSTNDSPALTRTLSTYQPNGSDRFRESRRSFRNPLVSSTQPTSSPPPSPPPDSPRAPRLSDKERKERKRRQNTESARRTRERRRAEKERLEMVYDAREVRIKELEIAVDQLSRELRQSNTTSELSKKGKNGSGDNEERPKWFGAPF